MISLSAMLQFDEEVLERVATVLVAMFFATTAGVLGYHWIEGWSLFDSLYMTVITFTTVGYGEVHPLSTQGRAFTIFLLIFGIGVLTYSISTITAFIIDGDLKDVIRRRRMEAKIAKLTRHYILCGAGHTGQTIIEELQKTRREFVVVEKDAGRIASLHERGILALQGDSTRDEILVKAGVMKARGVFAALSTDPDNVFLAIGARGLNPELRIVSKQQDAGGVDKFKRSGADVVVNPGFIGGLRMASEMIRPAATGFLDSMLRAKGQVFRIEEVTVPKDSPFIGRPLESIKGSQGNAALLLAVKHPQENTYEINPDPARVLEAGEIIVAMGSMDHIKELAAKVAAA